jgi:hypothetical protein
MRWRHCNPKRKFVEYLACATLLDFKNFGLRIKGVLPGRRLCRLSAILSALNIEKGIYHQQAWFYLTKGLLNTE